MNISVMWAREAKNSFWEFINTAQREPVVVTKKEKPVWVFLSLKDLWKNSPVYEAIKNHFGDEKKENSYINMLWINKKIRSFKDTKEVDDFISNLRKEWI